MASSEHQKKLLYSLTSLQIGDMQSYLSKLYLHADHGSEKLVFFVDNGPWTAERSGRSKPVELWQLMVTQSRTSPFANRSFKYALIDRMQNRNHKELPSSTPAEQWSLKRRLFQRDRSCFVNLLRDLFPMRLRSVVSIQELSHLLYGCVTFELEWKDVKGINYLNELQTDTCVALELKLLVKRDFCDIEAALSFYGIDSYEAFSANSHLMSASRNFDLRKNLQLENSFVGANGEVLSPGSSYSDEFFSDFTDVGRECPCGDSHVCHYHSDSDYEDFHADCKLDDAVPSNTSSCTCGIVDTGGLNVNFCGKCGCRVEGPSSTEAAFTTPEASSHLLSCEDTRRYPMDEASGQLPALEEDSWHTMNLESDHLEFQSAAPNSSRESNHSDDGSLSSSLQNGDDDDEELLVYQDVLVIFRFCDPILPLDLKEIITADQRLLKMLESGLPSWVIFLQSYPVVRKLYRPWMRPLAKTMYILVSIITVIIGFYDLYKNVPVLKATAARICGPFFEWIEAWEMVSRIKYLGTVLFLQNWEKAFRWLILVFRTMRKLSSLLLQPMMEPLKELAEFIWPLWNLVFDTVWGLASVLWVICASIIEYINFVSQLIILPVFWLLTAIWTLVTWVLYPFIYGVWGVIVLPVRLIMLLAEFVVALVCSIYNTIQNVWHVISNFIQLFSVAGPQAGKTANSSASTLRLLWNDIFSQVFRAIRSIVNVFLAFLMTCNRHRLSIYKHVEAFVFQLRCLVKCAPAARVACHEALDTPMLTNGSFEDERLRRGLRGSAGVGSAPRQRRRKGSLTGK